MAIKVEGVTAIDNSRTLPVIENITGSFTDFFPNVSTLTSGASVSVSMDNPCMTLTLASNATLDGTLMTTGEVSTLLLDTSATPYTPTFNADFKFSPSEPTWSDHRYWVISLFASGGTEIIAMANGFDA